MTGPFFSVIMATFNRADVLPRALDSILGQEGEADFEIIVTDDGSTDQTSEVLESYRDRVVVLEQENSGPASARNLAIEHARGNYVCFLDSDDYWFPWTLAVYREIIEQNKFPSFVVAEMLETDEGSLERPEQDQEIQVVCSDCYFQHLGSFFMIGCGNMIVERKALLEAGCFPTTRMSCEDSDLCLRLGTAPGFVRIQAPPTVAYVRHVDSLSISGLDHILVGVRHIISQEKGGLYPGGEHWENQRSMLVSTHARSTTVNLLKAGRFGEGLRLYRDCFKYHWRSRRFKFMCAFPLMLVAKVATALVPGKSQ